MLCIKPPQAEPITRRTALVQCRVFTVTVLCLTQRAGPSCTITALEVPDIYYDTTDRCA